MKKICYSCKYSIECEEVTIHRGEEPEIKDHAIVWHDTESHYFCAICRNTGFDIISVRFMESDMIILCRLLLYTANMLHDDIENIGLGA